jgi:hypothetical protein
MSMKSGFIPALALALALIGGAALAAEPAAKTVAQVFGEKGDLNGKQVKVRGKVVKFNGGILGKNFLHIQDGTGGAGTNDLTITTQQEARVGDQITAIGTVVTDKNLGSGYSYDVLIEDASIKLD